jgi:hypothetical protein
MTTSKNIETVSTFKTVKQNIKKITPILVENGLDWEIGKFPFTAFDGFIPLDSNYYGLYNMKTMENLNSVGENYHVSQNADLINILIEGTKQFGDKLRISKAGSLRGGRKVFVQMEIVGDAIVGNDTIKKYITILDSNDGSCSLAIGIGDKTMSCQNQFVMFYKGSDTKLRHTPSLKQQIEVMPNFIQLALSKSLKQMELYQAFQSTPITRELAHEMVSYLMGYDRISVETMDKKPGKISIDAMDLLYKNIDLEIADKGLNLWGLHSGVTRFTTHGLSVGKKENAKIESIVSTRGSAYKKNQKSLEFATRNLPLEKMLQLELAN